MTTKHDIDGLTEDEVLARIREGRVNRVHSKTSRSIASIIRGNVVTLFNGILVGAAVLVLVFGHPQDVVFGAVMVFNAIIGIVSEVRAKRTLDALAIVDAPTATVIRSGAETVIGVEEIVLDDLLRVGMGDQVSVDGLVLESRGLEVDESILTGESTPVKKAIGEPILAGTSIVAGSGLMRATAVGEDTYAQDISRRARVFTRTNSHIQASINKVLKVVSALLPIMVALTLWSHARIADGVGWSGSIVLAVASVVGLIPQGLVLLTSMNFAIGSATLARRGVLVQELAAVEVLARVDALCVDKTGTLTTGRIRVRETDLDPEAEERCRWALRALSQDRANSTARAIAEAIGAPESPVEALWTIPFSSARKWSAIGAEDASWYLGAPEILAPDGGCGAYEEAIGAHQSEGLRVVALARAARSDTAGEGLPEEREIVSIVVLEEELRSDAAETMDYFRRQGVRVRVISGDHPGTVSALASRVGLRGSGGAPLLTRDARSLPEDTLSDDFARIVEETDVFGRVTPEQKRAMVQALQANGHCVAMTGDGVNDALALKDADLGIAMGNGARATKAVAEIVLVDSRFDVLPGVLAEGRRIIANMERVSALFLAKTVYAGLIVIACAALAVSYPFLPRHFTYIDAFTIGVPAFVLALAPNPRRYVPGFLRRTLSLAIPAGASIAAGALASYWIAGPGSVAGSTAATLTLMIGALWLLSVTARPLFGWRAGLLALMAGGAVLGVLIPSTRHFFTLADPTGPQWLMIVLIGLASGLLIEILQRVFHHARHEAAEREGVPLDAGLPVPSPAAEGGPSTLRSRGSTRGSSARG